MKRNITVEIISTFFILLFLYTAISKYMDHATFVQSLSISPFLWIRRIAIPVSFLLPAFELFVAFCLLLDTPLKIGPLKISKKTGLWMSLGLMLFFTVYVSYILYSPTVKHVPCNCGGLIQLLSWRQHVYFNSVSSLLALIALLIYWRSTGQSFSKSMIKYS
jgi:hypothetical protein